MSLYSIQIPIDNLARNTPVIILLLLNINLI